jgi:DNA-binding NtrC family response regulator
MTMSTPLRILYLEDNPKDAELILAELRRSGFEPDCCRVDSEAGYVARLAAGTFDLIIADYNLPSFSALGALSHLQDRGSDIPFIVATGTLADDQAMECIKRGATDYVLKDRLARLGHAVAQALEEKRKRTERKELEEQLQQAQKMEAVGG